MDELFNIPDFILNNQDEIEKHIDYHFDSQKKLLIQALHVKHLLKKTKVMLCFLNQM